MTNKIGTVVTASNSRKYIHIRIPCAECGADAARIIDLPDHLKCCPDGLIVYIDRDGRLQAMEEP